jgi:hypothetical protein
MDVQFGSVEAIGAAASYVDNAAAVMDYDSGGNFAQFGAKVGSVGSAGAKIRTVSAGVVKDAVIISPDGITITLLGGNFKFPAAWNSSANANTLDDYDEYTAASSACTNAITTAAIWKLTKFGNVVTLTLPDVSGTATALTYFGFGTLMPAKYRPSATLSFQVANILNNGALVTTTGVVYVRTDGEIRIYRDGTFATAYTNAAAAGVSGVSVSWTI